MLHLREPSERYEKMWYSLVNEFRDKGEKIIPAALTYGCEKYSDYLKKARDFGKGEKLPGNIVPQSVYFLFDDAEDKILGCIAMRHKLNDALRFSGGHIGYCVAPSERGKGYGKAQLALILPICRKLGLDRILLTCDKANSASSETMKANGAVFSEEFINTDGIIKERYWLEL